MFKICTEGHSLPISALDFEIQREGEVQDSSCLTELHCESCTLCLLCRWRGKRNIAEPAQKGAEIEKNSLLAATMCQGHVMPTSLSRYMLLCWIYLDVKTEAWGLVYIPEPGCGRAKVWTQDHIPTNHTHPFHQPLFFKGWGPPAWTMCLETAQPGHRRARIQMQVCLPMCMDISTCLWARRGSYSWLARRTWDKCTFAFLGICHMVRAGNMRKPDHGWPRG